MRPLIYGWLWLALCFPGLASAQPGGPIRSVLALDSLLRPLYRFRMVDSTVVTYKYSYRDTVIYLPSYVEIRDTVYVVDTVRLDTDLRHLQAVVWAFDGRGDSTLRGEFYLYDGQGGGPMWTVWGTATVETAGDSVIERGLFITVDSASAARRISGHQWREIWEALGGR